MTPDPISHKQQEIDIKKMLNSKVAMVIFTMIITAFCSVLLTGYKYSGELDEVKTALHLSDSTYKKNFDDMSIDNKELLNALKTSNAAVINLNTSMERMQVQMDFVQRDLDFIRKKIDK